jgi:kynureninase
MKTSDLGPFPTVPGHEEALRLDAADPLADYREKFIHADDDTIYLDGNSLGRLPALTPDVVDDATTRQWGDRLIRSWNEGWWDLQVRLGDKLAPLLGAKESEVLISDSTSVNLYKLAMAAVSAAPEGGRRIVTDDLNFPSDVYILNRVASAYGGSLEVVSSDGVHGPMDGLARAIDESTALVSLSHTTYASGYTYDIEALTRLAHGAGAAVLWDCSHSVGAMPIELGRWEVDLAVGCTYKYLSGGPGSPAFLYVRPDLIEQLPSPIPGWWAHNEPFEFDLDFTPTSTIRKFHTGTMPILSLAAIEPGLDLTLAAGPKSIREKSVALSGYLIEEWREHLEPLGFELASPVEPEHRGSHVSLRHPLAWPINRSMIEDVRVIPDFRGPDNLRLGLAPLYTRFVDVHTAGQRMRKVVTEDLHQTHLQDRAYVT